MDSLSDIVVAFAENNAFILRETVVILNSLLTFLEPSQFEHCDSKKPNKRDIWIEKIVTKPKLKKSFVLIPQIVESYSQSPSLE